MVTVGPLEFASAIMNMLEQHVKPVRKSLHFTQIYCFNIIPYGVSHKQPVIKRVFMENVLPQEFAHVTKDMAVKHAKKVFKITKSFLFFT